MFTWFRKQIWTFRHMRTVEACTAFIKDQQFPKLNPGRRMLVDGMSANACVFLCGSVEDRGADTLLVRVTYSVKYKGTVDALGSYLVSCSNDEFEIVDRDERPC